MCLILSIYTHDTASHKMNTPYTHLILKFYHHFPQTISSVIILYIVLREIRTHSLKVLLIKYPVKTFFCTEMQGKKETKLVDETLGVLDELANNKMGNLYSISTTKYDGVMRTIIHNVISEEAVARYYKDGRGMCEYLLGDMEETDNEDLIGEGISLWNKYLLNGEIDLTRANALVDTLRDEILISPQSIPAVEDLRVVSEKKDTLITRAIEKANAIKNTEQFTSGRKDQEAKRALCFDAKVTAQQLASEEKKRAFEATTASEQASDARRQTHLTAEHSNIKIAIDQLKTLHREMIKMEEDIDTAIHDNEHGNIRKQGLNDQVLHDQISLFKESWDMKFKLKKFIGDFEKLNNHLVRNSLRQKICGCTNERHNRKNQLRLDSRSYAKSKLENNSCTESPRKIARNEGRNFSPCSLHLHLHKI